MEPPEAHNDGCSCQVSGWGCVVLVLAIIGLLFLAKII